MAFILIPGSLFWGRSYEEISHLSQNQQVLIEGQIVKKEYKDSTYGGYWQLVLKDVRMAVWKEKMKNSGQETREEKTESEDILELKGKYLCRLSKNDASIKIGQQVVMKANYVPWEEATNPGQFDMKKWYCSQGILGQVKKADILRSGREYSVLGETMWKIRSRIKEELKFHLGEKDGSLVAAMLLGEKDGLEEESKSLYQRNGISHVLAISGLHLTVLGMGIFTILKHVFGNNKGVAVLSSSLMLLYCIFTGSSISTVRATIMFLLSFLAKISGRSYDTLSALGLAAIMQLFLNPYGLNSSGFGLSFLAVIGVTFVAPRLQELLEAKKALTKSICVSLGASLVTLPILLVNYGTFPWYSILLNLCILPVMSFLLFLAVFLVVLFPFSYLGWEVGEIYNGVALLGIIRKIVIVSLKLLLKYLEICCQLFEKMPLKDGYLGSSNRWQIIVYLLLLAVVCSRFVGHSLFCKKMILLSALSLLTVKTDFGTELVMLDVGQGDSCVLRSNYGNIYISDCGSSSVSQVGKYRLIPFLKYKGYGKIKGIFLSHMDQDHISGIVELLESAKEENMEIENLFLPKTISYTEKDREKLEEILQLAAVNKINVLYLVRGDKITDGGMQIQCLHPKEEAENGGKEEDRNNQSLVLLVSEDNRKVLLAADVEEEGEKEILEYIDQNGIDIQSDILKVAHHGSAGSGSEVFLQKVRPQLALISCGRNNRYGHPHEETLHRLEEVNSQKMSTMELGAITIKIGKNVRVSSY